MLTLTSAPAEVNPAADWPAWTDEDRWGLGPEPNEDDRRWWAEQGESWDGPDDSEPDWDELASESEALDRLERGLCC